MVKKMREGEKFKYLGVIASADGDMSEEMSHRLIEGKSICRTMRKLWKESIISKEVERELYERVVIQGVVFDSYIGETYVA